MKSEHTTEIRHHAIIAGVVTFVLASVDLARAFWLTEVPNRSLLDAALGVVGLILAGVLGFVLVYVLESRWSRVQQVVIPKFGGSVDGIWIYVTNDVREPNFDSVSVVTILSSRSGFKLNGSYYRRENIDSSQDHPNPSGSFDGTGQLWNNNGIYYSYEGWESQPGGREKDDHGVGYLIFDRPDGIECPLRGAFTGFSLQDDPESRLVQYGRKLTKTEEDQYKAGHAGLLLEHLDKHPKERSGKYAWKDIGEVDGTWLEAIYQEGKLIEGSRIIIDSSSDGRFEISGRAYIWQKMREAEQSGSGLEHLEPDRYFSGEGHVSTHWTGIYYAFGYSANDLALGTGYYWFRPKEEFLTLQGAFMLKTREPHRVVFAKRIKQADQKTREMELLFEYLKERKQVLDQVEYSASIPS